jgi:xanthine dehydrogenase accessory factor
VLGGAGPRLLTYGISDDLALEVGLPCGGEIDVFVEEADEQLTDRLRQVIEDDRRAVLFTIVEGEGVGERWLAVEGEETDAPAGLAAEVDDLLRSGRSGVLEHEGRRVFADVFEPPLRLLVIGAVDTAEALCRAARQLGWRTIVADARGKFATPERIPSADELFVGWPDEAFDRVRPDSTTAVVVLTHEHALARISGPCGLDIGAVTPAETALSILAEILASRADRAGGPLQTAGGRIHAGVD